MRAGRLRTLVLLEEPYELTNEIGEREIAWRPIAEVRAARRVLSGTERHVVAQDVASMDLEWEIRYRPIVDPRWRVREKVSGQVHEIASPPMDPDGRRRRLLIRTRTAQPLSPEEWRG